MKNENQYELTLEEWNGDDLVADYEVVDTMTGEKETARIYYDVGGEGWEDTGNGSTGKRINSNKVNGW